MAPSPQQPAVKLLILDGHAYAYRAFHAIRSLSSPSGEPTNAIFGFVKTLQKLLTQVQPSHLVVVWDGGLAAERMELLPGYKAQRPPMPASLEKQLDQIVVWLKASGIASHCQEGVEADDWIATLARQSAAAGAQVIIASSDKDFMQLVSPTIGLLNPNDKEERIWTAAEVRAKSGVEPGQIVDWLSLVGDSVDNIPGVAGVGAKTAARLLNQFGSCEEIWVRLSEVESNRLRAALESSQEIVRRNQRMIRLRDDLAGDARLDGMGLGATDPRRLFELYTQWGFRSLASAAAGAMSSQGDLFGEGTGSSGGTPEFGK
jgi:DNA polymerase-1